VFTLGPQHFETIVNSATDVRYVHIDDESVRLPRLLLTRLNIALSDQELCGQLPLRCLQLLIHQFECICLCFCLRNQTLSFTFSFQDLALFFGLGLIDVRNAFALWCQNWSTFVSFGLRLKNHCIWNVAWWVNVFDLVSESRDAPVFRLFLDSCYNLWI